MTERTDQADSGEQLRSAISHQGLLLGQHEALIQTMIQQQTQVMQTMSSLTRELQDVKTLLNVNPPTSVPPPAASAPVVPAASSAPDVGVSTLAPEPFTGDLSKSRGFLLQCSLVFSRSPRSFPDDAHKISYLIGLFRDRALRWAESFIDEETIHGYSYADFLDRFKRTFASSMGEEEAAKKLWSLKQGSRSVADFTVDFRTLAAQAGWDYRALKAVFLNALSEKLKDELASRDKPDSLEDLIDLAIRVDERLRERVRERRSHDQSPAQRSSPSAPPVPSQARPIFSQPTEEPMQIGRAHLSAEERDKRIRGQLCLYCGGTGHFRLSCPLRPKDQVRQ